MNLQNVLSVYAFAAFVVVVLIRTAVMRKKGIRAFVFGVTDKTDFLLVPMVLAIAYTILAKIFGLPIWKPLIKPFWDNDVIPR